MTYNYTRKRVSSFERLCKTERIGSVKKADLVYYVIYKSIQRKQETDRFFQRNNNRPENNFGSFKYS